MRVILYDFISKIVWVLWLFFMTLWHKWIIVNSVSWRRSNHIQSIISPLTLSTLQLDCAFFFCSKIVNSVKWWSLENSSILRGYGSHFKNSFSRKSVYLLHLFPPYPSIFQIPPSLLTQLFVFWCVPCLEVSLNQHLFCFRRNPKPAQRHFSCGPRSK